MGTATRRMFQLESRGVHFGYDRFTLVKLDRNRPFSKQRLEQLGFQLVNSRDASMFFSDADIRELSRQAEGQIEVLVFAASQKNCFTLRSIWDQFSDVVIKDGEPSLGYYALCTNRLPSVH